MRSARIGVWDWVIAVAVAAILVATGLSEHRDGTNPLGYALLAVAGLALVAGCRSAVPVLVVTGLCTVGYQAMGFDVAAVAYVVAVYAAMRAGHRIATVVTSVLMLVMLAILPETRGREIGQLEATAGG